MTKASQPERPVVGRLKSLVAERRASIKITFRIVNQLYDCVELRLRTSRTYYHQNQHSRPPTYAQQVIVGEWWLYPACS